MAPADNAPSSRLDDAIAGFSAGVVGTLMGYPLDTVKVHMQAEAVRRGSSGVLSSARAIFASGGFSAFYAGVAAPFVSLAALNTINFTCYASFRALLGVPPRDSAEHRPFNSRVVLAGALVGPVAAIISTPAEMVKVQMQLHGTGSGGVHRSTWHTLTSIVRALGVRGLYVGWWVNVARETAFGAGFFGAYEAMRDQLEGRQGLRRELSVFLAGGSGGLTAWMLSLPFDTVKSVLQAHDIRSGPPPTSAQIARRVFRARGLLGFWRGALPSTARAFIVSSTRFSVFDFTLSTLRSRRQPGLAE